MIRVKQLLFGRHHMPRFHIHGYQEEGTTTPFDMNVRNGTSRYHLMMQAIRLNDVLPLMANRDVNQLPVVQDGKLVGVLTRDAVIRTLEVRRGLGLDEDRAA